MKMAVYGTLRRGYGNHERLMKKCTFERLALTKPKYTMYASMIPFVVPHGTEAITVEVYDVPAECLPAIDALEGHPSVYRRTEIELEDGSKVHMYLYQVGEHVPSGDFKKYKEMTYVQY